MNKLSISKLTSSIISTFMMFNILSLSGCEDTKDTTTQDSNLSEELIFISSEGSFGSTDGSISVLKNGEKIQSLLNLGNVVQSILVHENMLFVAINGNSEIKRYEITKDGLNQPGITISTNASEPREMVVFNNKLYFTNWATNDIKSLNLFTYVIEDFITLEGLPEDIITDGEFLYASIPNLVKYDPGNGSSVVKIDPSSNQIIETFEVGRGPQHLIINNNILWVSRTYYSDNFYETYYAGAKIDLISNEVTKIEYGLGVVCGGDVMIKDNKIYRTYNGGIAEINENNLEIRSSSRVGDYSTYSVYSASVLEEKAYFGITSDYVSPDTVYVHNSSGELENYFEVEASPGDFAKWRSN